MKRYRAIYVEESTPDVFRIEVYCPPHFADEGSWEFVTLIHGAVTTDEAIEKFRKLTANRHKATKEFTL